MSGYVERYFVALAALATPIEAEAKALAADLGTTAYEERLKLAGALPAIVLATVDAAAAQALLGKLRARRHRALLARASDVVAAAEMVAMRHFQITGGGLESGGEELPWSAIAVLVRARQLKHLDTTTVIKEKKLALGRAVMTGGLLMRKTQTREVVTHAEDIEQILYVFRNDGGTPWLMRELSTNYGALGAALAPNAHANFGIATELFRKRAPHARFDDTLLRRPALDDVDLYAHLIAQP
jgi:hypothetical protein